MSNEKQDTDLIETMDYEALLEMGVIDEMPQEQELGEGGKIEDIK